MVEPKQTEPTVADPKQPDPPEWMNEVARQDDETLIGFVAKFAGRAHSHTAGDKIARTHIRLSKRVLGSFLDIDAVLARLRRLSKGNGELAEASRGLVVLLEKKSDGHWE